MPGVEALIAPGRTPDIKRDVRTEAKRAEVLSRVERGEISVLDAVSELGVGRSRIDQLLLARRRSLPPTPAVAMTAKLATPARSTALQEAIRDDRARVRPDQTQPRHQTLRPSRHDRREQRMEAHRRNPQHPQALAAHEPRHRLNGSAPTFTTPGGGLGVAPLWRVRDCSFRLVLGVWWLGGAVAAGPTVISAHARVPSGFDSPPRWWCTQRPGAGHTTGRAWKGCTMRDSDRSDRGLGPFTGGQLSIVIVAVAAMFAIPTAALAAGGAFTNNSATVPAVQATNSNAKGVGVQGTGKKYGVFSNGPLGVAAGKSLSCSGCVGSGALATDARSLERYGDLYRTSHASTRTRPGSHACSGARGELHRQLERRVLGVRIGRHHRLLPT